MRPEEYTIDYFINKFDAIPDEKWGIGDLCRKGKCCALGHCELEDYSKPNDEVTALVKIFANGRPLLDSDTNNPEYSYVYMVNDLFHGGKEQPKQNILEKLKELKDGN